MGETASLAPPGSFIVPVPTRARVTARNKPKIVRKARAEKPFWKAYSV